MKLSGELKRTKCTSSSSKNSFRTVFMAHLADTLTVHKQYPAFNFGVLLLLLFLVWWFYLFHSADVFHWTKQDKNCHSVSWKMKRNEVNLSKSDAFFVCIYFIFPICDTQNQLKGRTNRVIVWKKHKKLVFNEAMKEKSETKQKFLDVKLNSSLILV